MLNVKEWDNKDDIQKAVEGLNQFTKNWCINCEESEKQNELVFRCEECIFERYDDKCQLKVFKNKHLPDFKDFGAMGDL